jgi:class 3 adenylate cyclase/tetratricopeptide (TPR) repeat protein
MSAAQQQLLAAIAALEAQRALLGDAVVDTMLGPARAQLAALAAADLATPEPAQALRQVSILFLDVVGFTTLSRQLDPESISAVMDDALMRGTTVVQQHRGKVLQYAGDNILAAFGADETREDDAERAVHCGLALLALGRTLGAQVLATHGHAGFDVRVGIHTGGVLLGGGVDAEGSIRGMAVNIAARMEQSAPPGALRISHDTWNHVRGLFDVEAQPPLQVKGVDAPMTTYLVRAARDRRSASVERGLQGLHTPLVGRAAELQRLQDTLARARDTRQLQALTLLGDAGLGKSRLLREWTAGLADGHVVALRSLPDGLLRPWGLLRSLLAVLFGIADTDSAELARHKLVDGLAPWFDDAGERQAQLIGQLSGLDFGPSPHLRGLDPRSLRDQALAAVLGLLQHLAARHGGVAVLVVEDLHWADDSSLDLLQHLLAHAAELPLMLVMTARPALLTRRPAWAGAEALVPLSPLAAAAGEALAQALLQRLAAVPAPLMQLVVGQAEGNPYYMEELVRRLVDDGVIVIGEPHWTVQPERLQAVRLPGTLVGLLQARLDALPAGERLAARQASVIGHVFWDDALQALDANALQALPALQREAFVKAHAASDFEGTTEHQFHHHLLHQVTYDTLLKAERRLGHGAVARWLAERTRGRGAEFLAMTGEHAERAGETALAIDCFEQAGLEAQKRFANTAAIAWLRRAADLLGASAPLRRYDLLERLVNLTDMVGDRPGQEATIQALLALLEQHPDDRRQAGLWLSMALLADRRSDAAASERLARQAFELADRCGAHQTAALAQGQLAMLQRALEAPLRVIGHLEIGLQSAARVESEIARAHVEGQLQTLLAMASAQLCRFDEARARLRAVLARGEALGLPRLQLGALGTLAETDMRQGRWDAVLSSAQRMRELAQASGIARSLADAHACLALVAEAQGDPVAAAGWNEQALATLRAIGNRRMEVPVLQHLGLCQFQRGDLAGAKAWQRQAQALCEDLDDRLGAGEAAAQHALCEARLGQTAAAQTTVDHLLAQLLPALAARPAHETIRLRWACHQVLVSLGDGRAGPMLQGLSADVQARAAELTDATDRTRLVQALPVFRAVMAAAQA